MSNVLEAVEIKRAVEKDLLKRRGVTGVDVGFKNVKGEETEEVAIRVFVSRKHSQISTVERIPNVIQGVKTDVIEATFRAISTLPDLAPYNPFVGGIAIGAGYSTFHLSTLGAFVLDNQTGDPMALTSFHGVVPPGTEIHQPFNRPPHVLTKKMGTVERTLFGPMIDAAVVRLIDPNGYTCAITELGSASGSISPTLGLEVAKRGYVSGLTFGSVSGISGTFQIQLAGVTSPFTFTEQSTVYADNQSFIYFGQEGDSGSLVVAYTWSNPATNPNDPHQAVGLLIGSTDPIDTPSPPPPGKTPSRFKPLAIMTPIDRVLESLAVHLC